MSAADLIQRCREAGVELIADGQALRVRGPGRKPFLPELHDHKAEILHLLQRLAAGETMPADKPEPLGRDLRELEGVPVEWIEGVLLLREVPRPPTWPGRAWQQLLVDAEWFLQRWGVQAARLGWQTWEVFGCCRAAPWARIQGMGLPLLMRGREVVALTDCEAVIQTCRGARQTYRRKPVDPLHPAERCLVWELEDGC